MAGRPADLLCLTAPKWFAIASESPVSVSGVASSDEWTWPTGIELTISATIQPVVQESVPGTVLPARCPDRHVQWDQTFCLGLSPPLVRDEATAVAWWANLHQYLTCQSVAAETKLWPGKNALDHGAKAGALHLRALRLAADLGIEDDYERTHDGEPTWLNGRGLLRLGWTPRDHDFDPSATHRPRFKYRRRNTRKILALMVIERRRASELDRYWREEKAKGTPCCQTMKGCPLAN